MARLSITPVKSMQLQHPAGVRLERFGVAEDRRFYVVDADGRLLSGPAHDRLFPVKAEYDPSAERLALRFPGGGTVEGEVAAVTGPTVGTSFWGRPVAGREVAGPWAMALSDHVGSPVRLVRTDRPGQAVDSHAVSIFSTASAEELDRQAGRSDRPLDRRRWRMLVEVAGSAAHEEDGWIGRRVRIGEATVEVIRTDPRCRITTLDPDTGFREFDTLKVIAAYRGADPEGGLPFGVYAEVVEPGAVRVGDPVHPLPS